VWAVAHFEHGYRKDEILTCCSRGLCAEGKQSFAGPS
jgi:hypothetical protein